jgi:hypothetical protein
MLKVELARWKQALEDLRRASVQAAHPRTRERFQALYLIASGRFNATTCAALLGRQDEAVLAWVHLYNRLGPAALTYRHSGGRAPSFTQEQSKRIVAAVEDTEPADHGLPGHLWALKELKQKRRVVLSWDNAPCHVARVVKAAAAGLGLEVVNLPGYSPDLNPSERLWGWLREEVTRGFCHAGVPEPLKACQDFIARINRDPLALVDRLWPKFELDPEFEAKLRVPT